MSNTAQSAQRSSTTSVEQGVKHCTACTTQFNYISRIFNQFLDKFTLLTTLKKVDHIQDKQIINQWQKKDNLKYISDNIQTHYEKQISVSSQALYFNSIFFKSLHTSEDGSRNSTTLINI
jgi:hypothetical protein